MKTRLEEHTKPFAIQWGYNTLKVTPTLLNGVPIPCVVVMRKGGSYLTGEGWEEEILQEEIEEKRITHQVIMIDCDRT
jgi:hypothetical protein